MESNLKKSIRDDLNRIDAIASALRAAVDGGRSLDALECASHIVDLMEGLRHRLAGAAAEDMARDRLWQMDSR